MQRKCWMEMLDSFKTGEDETSITKEANGLLIDEFKLMQFVCVCVCVCVTATITPVRPVSEVKSCGPAFHLKKEDEEDEEEDEEGPPAD